MPNDLHTRAAPVAPSTLDRENRRVEVVGLSGYAPVLRRDRAPDGSTAGWYEELDGATCDLSALIGGPVLRDHKPTTDNHVGVVEAARVEPGDNGPCIIATIRFSEKPAAEELFRDVAAGILRTVSLGYSVTEWTPAGRRNGLPVFRAKVWRAREASWVPLPADAGATVRGANMDDITTAAPADTAAQTTTTEQTRATDAPLQNRAAVNAEIRSMGDLAGLDRAWSDALIDRGATVEEARTDAFRAMAQRAPTIRTDAPRVQVLATHDDPRTRAAQMGEALFARIDPAHQLSEPARRYAYVTPADMARELLTLRGESVIGASPASLITRSLHTTSDFSIILSDAVGRVLRQSYMAAPSGLKRVARQTTARDFRTKHAAMLSEAPVLEKLNEAGEIKAGTLAEAEETYAVETFARKLGVSRQILVNDDLLAFSDMSRKFGQAAAETEARVIVALLAANSGNGQTMKDGNPLFHSSHANKAASGAVISDTTLSAARLAMRTQAGLAGQIIAVTPRFLIVPAALETTAEKWLASIAPATAANVNPFGGKLELVVEPRLDAVSGTRWYVAASPDEVDGLEIAYLSGANGPVVTPIQTADTDGVVLKVVHDFGAGFVETRSWFANAGA